MDVSTPELHDIILEEICKKRLINPGIQEKIESFSNTDYIRGFVAGLIYTDYTGCLGNLRHSPPATNAIAGVINVINARVDEFFKSQNNG